MDKTVGTMRTGYMLVGVAVLAFIPFFILCGYVFPVNDDYYFALEHIDRNCFESVVDSWNNWSGRYFATFISSVNPFVISRSPFLLFMIFSAVVVLLFMISFIFFPLIGLKRYLRGIECMGLGALLLLVYISLFPSVSQAFYWFSSYTAYTIPSLMYMLLIVLLLRKDRIAGVTAFILAAIIPGGNEVIAVLTVCTLLYVSWIYGGRRYHLLTCVSVIAMIIVMLSPGNGIRMEYQLSSHPYIWTVAVSFIQTVGWLFLWMPLLLVATVIYIPLYGYRLSASVIFDVSFSRYLFAFAVTVFLAHIPPTLGLSSVMVDRTANCLLVFYVIAYFYGVNILLHRNAGMTKRLTEIILSRRYVMYGALFAFLFIGPFSLESPFGTAVVDILTGKASSYEDIQSRRVELTRNSCQGDTVMLPALGVTSRSLFVKELDDNDFIYDYRMINGGEGMICVESGDVMFEDNFTSLKNYNKRNRQ